MSMNAQLLVGYAVLWVVLIKALFMRARVIPSECPRCGRLFERRELGGTICSCDRLPGRPSAIRELSAADVWGPGSDKAGSVSRARGHGRSVDLHR